MKRGKKICKTLKEIRLQVARANDIPYEPTECKHEGDCLGTCPKCEQEVRYIERQLDIRRMLGKAVAVAGVSAGLAALTACHTHRKVQTDVLEGDVVATNPDPEEHQLPEGMPPAPDINPDGQNNDCKEPKSMVVATDTIKQRVLMGDLIEHHPSFPGGQEKLMEFLEQNVSYPKEFGDIDCQGRVIVSFVIEEDGSISNPKVVKSLDPILDKEALRVISIMPKWIPGEQNGKPVRIKYSLPVTFKVK